ncbi:MAG: helix-turn-helix transcriptional regulator [Ruminococcaceae bacterium]|nr:helix-turn-helix transcriptional regulator [Oscillospiraceae bacterium]
MVFIKTIEFEKLRDNGYFLKNIVTDFQFWRNSSCWSTPVGGRINTAFLMALSRNVIYRPKGMDSVCVFPGDIILLPKGSEYECSFHKCDDPIELRHLGYPVGCLFLGFDLYDEDFENITFSGAPRVILSGRNSELVHRLEQICKLSARAECTPGVLSGEVSIFLSQLCTKYLMTLPGNNSSSVMDKISAYIYENFTDVNVSKLIEMSDMSASTLRRRFLSRYGRSPVAYINYVKIEKAKSLFESGIEKIKDVSALCGFEDEFYFSRLFVKLVGISPSAYVRMIKNSNK